MNDSLVHRGPDGSGIQLLAGRTAAIGLGHRRLSIIDVEAGSQPMSNEDGTVWITYNGEVYNHENLRSELVSRGHRYKTRCDTETIVHAYEEWGVDCVKRLRGMFSFAIWDGRKECLFAARDRMGIKPFYYSAGDGYLICGSEIKALLASGWLSAELNLSAVPENLTMGYVAGTSTLFRNVYKLLPGHWLLWQNDTLKTEQYWEIPLPDAAPRVASEAEWVERFVEIFRESVQIRLMSDVPLGVFLSGGLDSSAIAATMADQMSEPVKTFSVGFESKYYSEFNFAREVAASIGADHHEVVLKPDQLFANLPKLIWHEEEPIRSAASVALAEVANLASAHVKVVLSGEGSDELFAGYERYWATLVNMRWGAIYQRVTPRWLRENCIRPSLWNWPLPLSLKKKISHTFLNYSLRPEEIVYENWHAMFPADDYQKMFTPDAFQIFKDASPYEDTLRLYNSRPNGNLLDRLLYTDQKTYLVELLRKQDAMSMSASIESRVPFLDHNLVEFAAQVPANLKIRHGKGKYLVKQAMSKMLPESIIKRKKMGFPVPISQWFRGDAVRVLRAVLMSERAREHGMFNIEYFKRLIHEHFQGHRDHTDALWTALNFELWTRIYIDGQSYDSITDELANSNKVAQASYVAGVA